MSSTSNLSNLNKSMNELRTSFQILFLRLNIVGIRNQILGEKYVMMLITKNSQFFNSAGPLA